jgi:hypothetical protein
MSTAYFKRSVNIIKKIKINLILIFMVLFLIGATSFVYAGSYSEVEIVYPHEKSHVFSFTSNDGSSYYLDSETQEIRAYDSRAQLIKKVNWKKTGNYHYLLKIDEGGNFVIYAFKSSKGIVLDKDGKFLGEPNIPNVKNVSFHDGIVYDRETGAILFKIDPKSVLGQKLFLNDFDLVRDKTITRLKLLIKKPGKLLMFRL